MSYDIVMINMQITMHINISATNTTPTTSQQHSSHTIQLARGHGDKILVGNGNRDIRLIGLGLARERRRRRFQVERPRLDGTRLGLYVKLKDGVDLWVGNGQVEDGKWKMASGRWREVHQFSMHFIGDFTRHTRHTLDTCTHAQPSWQRLQSVPC